MSDESSTPITDDAFDQRWTDLSICPWDLSRQFERERNHARYIACILHEQLQLLANQFVGGIAPPIPQLPWLEIDLSRDALLTAVREVSQ